jgi:hypothetical protein
MPFISVYPVIYICIPCYLHLYTLLFTSVYPVICMHFKCMTIPLSATKSWSRCYAGPGASVRVAGESPFLSTQQYYVTVLQVVIIRQGGQRNVPTCHSRRRMRLVRATLRLDYIAVILAGFMKNRPKGGDRLQRQRRVTTVFSQAIVNHSSGEYSESHVKQSHCLW